MPGSAYDWEAEQLLRNRGRAKGSLTVWPSKESTGVASMQACALNAKLLEITANYWVCFCDSPAAIPIDTIRQEVLLFESNKS